MAPRIQWVTGWLLGAEQALVMPHHFRAPMMLLRRSALLLAWVGARYH